ncbi:hypothetical protein D9M70_510110 [compost metagenome]
MSGQILALKFCPAVEARNGPEPINCLRITSEARTVVRSFSLQAARALKIFQRFWSDRDGRAAISMPGLNPMTRRISRTTSRAGVSASSSPPMRLAWALTSPISAWLFTRISQAHWRTTFKRPVEPGVTRMQHAVCCFMTRRILRPSLGYASAPSSASVTSNKFSASCVSSMPGVRAASWSSPPARFSWMRPSRPRSTLMTVMLKPKWSLRLPGWSGGNTSSERKTAHRFFRHA